MAITTVGALVTALQKRNQQQRIRVIDEGSDTRAFQEFTIDRLVAGQSDPGQVKTVFIKVSPR